MRRINIPASLVGLASIAVLLFVRVLDPYPVRSIREIAFDQFQRFAPRAYQDVPVRIVDIDEASLRDYGQWPWPRTLLAEIVERLNELGAAAIVFDILFVEKDRLSPSSVLSDERISDLIKTEELPSLVQSLPDNDKIFAGSLASAPTVLGFSMISGDTAVAPPIKSGFAFTGADPSRALPQLIGVTQVLPSFARAADGLGSLNLSPTESISVVRTVPLLWAYGEQLFPSLAVESLRVAQGVSTTIVSTVSDASVAIESVRVGDFLIPTTSDGAFWVYFDHDRPERYVSAARLLGGPLDAELASKLAGHIVLIGTSASGLFDVRGTALLENVPGVSIHAQVLEQIISGKFLHRPDWVEGLELITFFLVGIYIVVMGQIAGPILLFAIAGIVAFGIASGAWLAFVRYGLLIDPTFQLIGYFIIGFALISFRYLIADRDKRQIRRAFSQFVAPTVLERIESRPEALKLGGEIRDMTVLFTDIRNFTPLSERMTPVALVSFLNDLLGRLSDDVISGQGTIDKFIGDSVMAFWNAPIDVPDHRLKACQTALQMRATMKRFNQELANASADNSNFGGPISIGIGINSGEACVGNMGSERRFDYSAIGDTVNIASRVESACKSVSFDIVLSDSTAAGADALATLEAGAVTVKGKSLRVGIHILVGGAMVAESTEFLKLAVAHSNLLQALREGRDNWEAALLMAKAAGEAVLPQLAGFYDAIYERRADFITSIHHEAV
jgi:adenylate cyclase